MGDHTEAIEIRYDPRRIGYEDLLRVFWDDHTPSAPAWSRQYRSAIFVHDDAQRAAAEASLRTEEARLGFAMHTAIEPVGPFTAAEDYHQKHSLRGSAVGSAFEALVPRSAWITSTAAARLNGWLAGYGDPETVRRELDRVGLDDDARAQVLQRVRSR